MTLIAAYDQITDSCLTQTSLCSKPMATRSLLGISP